ncbi:hypothetical protein ABPG72_011872 [Tetrahymena utriculariae]
MKQQKQEFKKLEDFLNSELLSLNDVYMNIDFNQLGEQNISGLSAALAICTNLSTLKLQANYKSKKQTDIWETCGLNRALASCNNLQNLSLILNDQQMFGLSTMLSSCSKLQTLKLKIQSQLISRKEINQVLLYQAALNFHILKLSQNQIQLAQNMLLALFLLQKILLASQIQKYGLRVFKLMDQVFRI